MNLTRTMAGLGLAALLAATAACGSDDTDTKDAAAATEKSAAPTTATPEGTATLFLQASAALDYQKICELLSDGESATKSDPAVLKECVEGFEMLLPADDEQTQATVEESKQALKDGPSKVEELSPTTAQVSYAALADGEPTDLIKVGDEWLVNLSGS